jgi:hypothetical protein
MFLLVVIAVLAQAFPLYCALAARYGSAHYICPAFSLSDLFILCFCVDALMIVAVHCSCAESLWYQDEPYGKLTYHLHMHRPWAMCAMFQVALYAVKYIVFRLTCAYTNMRCD